MMGFLSRLGALRFWTFYVDTQHFSEAQQKKIRSFLPREGFLAGDSGVLQPETPVSAPQRLRPISDPSPVWQKCKSKTVRDRGPERSRIICPEVPVWRGVRDRHRRFLSLVTGDSGQTGDSGVSTPETPALMNSNG